MILLEGLLDLDLEAAPHEPVPDEGHGGLVHPRGGVAVGYAHVHDHTLLRHRVILFNSILQFCIYHIKLEEERGPGEHDVGPPVDGDGGEHEAVESVQPGRRQ